MHSFLFNQSVRIQTCFPMLLCLALSGCVGGIPWPRIGRCYQGPDADGYVGHDYGSGAK